MYRVESVEFLINHTIVMFTACSQDVSRPVHVATLGRLIHTGHMISHHAITVYTPGGSNKCC